VFTGRVPFHAPTPLATIFMHMHEPPPVTGPAGAGIPEALRTVLLRALAKEPSGRYAGAGELVEALREARATTLGPADRRHTPAPLTSGDVEHTVIGTPEAMRAPLFTPAPAPPPLPATPPPASAPPWAGTPSVATVRADSTPTPVPPATRVPRPTPPPLRTVSPPPPPTATPDDVYAGGAFRETRRGNPRTAAALGVAAVVVLGSVGALAWRQFARSPGAGPESATASPSPVVDPAVDVSPSPVEPGGTASLGGSGSLGSTTARPSPALPSPSPSVRVAATDPVPDRPTAPVIGFVQVVVKPWAEVFVDGKTRGTTPLRKLELPPGSHTIRLVHPSFKPLQRRVTVRAGETTPLEIDLSWEAVPVGPAGSR
jgi:serine/threonine-protein kinase